jgi:hypothetical protein
VCSSDTVVAFPDSKGGASMNAGVSEDVLRRIWAEYAEMPGLSVTVTQAQRLWGLDRETCLTALEALTSAGFLRETETHQYTRASDGQPSVPFRMAKVQSSTKAAARALLQGGKTRGSK